MATDEGSSEQIAYSDAVTELEQILAGLDNDEIDVDVLAERVRRAAELIRLCRERITGARLEVERVVLELEADATRALDPDDPDEPEEPDEQVRERN